MRLDRWLAEAGLGSRREVAEMVRRRRVDVDGVVVTDPAAQIDAHARVCLDDAVVGERDRVRAVLLALHKPTGVLTALRDPWGRPGLESLLDAQTLRHWHPVGRLDLDTSGLLLLSADGAVTQRLLHPRRAIEREYRATVEGQPPADLAHLLAQGVQTAEGVFPARLVSVDPPDVQLAVCEGKHRMVRRILANVGLPVVALHRVRYGTVMLGDLEPGAVRVLDADEVRALVG